MYIQDEELRREIKRRLRERREKHWHFSQQEMAEYLRSRLDPTDRKYPSERTYVRWESLNSNELPQSGKKMTAVASIMDVELADLIASSEPGETPDFLLARRLDELIAAEKQTHVLLERILGALTHQDPTDDVRYLSEARD